VRALYVPVVAGLLTYVALLWAGPYLRSLVESGRRTRLVGTLGWAAVVVGAVSTAWAIVSLTLPQWALVHVDALTPVALGLGAASLGVGLWMLTSSQTPVGGDNLGETQSSSEQSHSEAGAPNSHGEKGPAPRPFAAAQRASLVVAAGAIVLGLFWITDIFAIAYGEDQARITNARLWSQENSVVLDADARLYLPVPPKQIKVTWAPPADPAAKPTFLRYQCFRSLAVHGDRWVLVPARWTPEYGYAVIITADSSHVISLNMVKNIADTDAAQQWDGGWECPEVGVGTKTK
jgi:hypothetical protein